MRKSLQLKISSRSLQMSVLSSPLTIRSCDAEILGWVTSLRHAQFPFCLWNFMFLFSYACKLGFDAVLKYTNWLIHHMWFLCVCDKKTIFNGLWRDKNSKGIWVVYLKCRTLWLHFFSFSVSDISPANIKLFKNNLTLKVLMLE